MFIVGADRCCVQLGSLYGHKTILLYKYHYCLMAQRTWGLIKKLNTGLLVSSKTTGLLPTPINSPKAYYDKRKKNIHVDFQNLNNVKTQSDLLCI